MRRTIIGGGLAGPYLHYTKLKEDIKLQFTRADLIQELVQKVLVDLLILPFQ